MKFSRRVFSLLLITLLLTIANSALAGTRQKIICTNAIQNLKTDTWLNVSDDSIYYKLKVKRDSIVTIDCKNLVDGGWYSVNFFLDSEGNKTVMSFEPTTDHSNSIFAIKKGIYYVKFWQFTKSTKVKLSIAKLVDKKNYCPSRAIKLARNTTFLSAQRPMYTSDKVWFKITTNKKQKITVTCIGSNWEPFGDILSSDLQWITEVEQYGEHNIKTKKALPAGTYYLSIGTGGYGNRYTAPALTVRWK